MAGRLFQIAVDLLFNINLLPITEISVSGAQQAENRVRWSGAVSWSRKNFGEVEVHCT